MGWKMGQKKSCHGRKATLRGFCAALGLAAGFAALAAPAPAIAGDDDTGDSFYSKTFGRVLETFGLQSGEKAGIDYRERPPLVLPPSHDLPPPEKSAQVTNPAWPKDPDVKRRKLLEQQEKHRNVSEEREREQNPLRPEQMTPGPKPRGVQTVNTGPGRSGATDFGEMYSPSQLGYKGGMWSRMFGGKDEDYAQFTGEPPRTDLTEPPPGYQTPSPDQPYGVTAAAPKADNNYEKRAEPVR